MARNTTRRLHGKALLRFYTQDVVSFGAAIAAADEDQPTTWLMLVTAMLLAVGAAYTISLELAPRVVGIPAGTFDAQPAYEQVRSWAPTAQLQPKPHLHPIPPPSSNTSSLAPARTFTLDLTCALPPRTAHRRHRRATAAVVRARPPRRGGGRRASRLDDGRGT